MRIVSLLFLVVLIAGCRTANRPVRLPGEGVTLCVENATIGYGDIIARVDQLRLDVGPSQTECRELTNIGGAIPITATTTGGGATGTLSYSATIPSSMPGCWHWRLGNSPASQVALAPCRD